MKHRKYSLLIADDEELIRRLIQALIPWDELGLELAASVGNGLEAIEYLKDHTADILITDARMPECDGIELIKWCSEQNRSMKYIVISGYRQFEYAQGALQYGADNYLLKPIDQQELTDSLNTIIQKLEDSNREDASELMQRQLEQNRDRMRRHFINSYVYDGRYFPDKEIPSMDYINEEFQMNFAKGIYRALILKVSVPEDSKMDLGSALARIREEADRRWGSYLTECVSCVMQFGVLYFINYPEFEEGQLTADIESLYADLTRMLDVFEGVRLTVGLSHREKDLRSVHRCAVTASDALRYQLYLPHVPIIDYDHYHFKEVDPASVWTQERSKMLENCMRTGNVKGIRKLIFDLKLEIHQDKEMSPVSIFTIAETAANNASEVFLSVVKSNRGQYHLRDDFLMELVNRRTVDSIADSLEQMILRSVKLMEAESKQQEIQPIRVIREYIDKHYAENISLNDIADQVQLSRNYVSAIFRKETGVNYLDYLTSKRINEAARLLRNTNLSISEISEKVGYTDVKYFSKMCKKKLGMNPSEYRKLYS